MGWQDIRDERPLGWAALVVLASLRLVLLGILDRRPQRIGLQECCQTACSILRILLLGITMELLRRGFNARDLESFIDNSILLIFCP
jgi:hypothetical protein